jgi:hypothetical protein
VERLFIAAAVIAIAVIVATLLRRRRPDPPTQPSWKVPLQLDRTDFDRPDTPWLVVVFSSATCDTCAGVWEKAVVLTSSALAVQLVEVGERPDLHRRYGINAVPTLVLADADGVVQASSIGPLSAPDLWSMVAKARQSNPALGNEDIEKPFEQDTR